MLQLSSLSDSYNCLTLFVNALLLLYTAIMQQITLNILFFSFLLLLHLCVIAFYCCSFVLDAFFEFICIEDFFLKNMPLLE